MLQFGCAFLKKNLRFTSGSTKFIVLVSGSCFFRQECLGVGCVAAPASTSSQGIVFLLDHNMLRQMCCHGMTDSNKKASAHQTGKWDIVSSVNLLSVLRLNFWHEVWIATGFRCAQKRSRFCCIFFSVSCLYRLPDGNSCWMSSHLCFLFFRCVYPSCWVILSAHIGVWCPLSEDVMSFSRGSLIWTVHLENASWECSRLMWHTWRVSCRNERGSGEPCGSYSAQTLGNQHMPILAEDSHLSWSSFAGFSQLKTFLTWNTFSEFGVRRLENLPGFWPMKLTRWRNSRSSRS